MEQDFNYQPLALQVLVYFLMLSQHYYISTGLNLRHHKTEDPPTHPDVGEVHPRPVGVHHHPGVGGEVAPAPPRPGVEVQVVAFLPNRLNPAGRRRNEAATSQTEQEASAPESSPFADVPQLCRSALTHHQDFT